MARRARMIQRQRPQGRAVALFRNRRGDRVDPASFSATDAKNQFGRALNIVTGGGLVVITRHDAPLAILVSVDEFNALASASTSKLNTLSDQFDAMLSQMQAPKARAGMKAAFNASPEDLGKAAVAVARKRG